MRNPSSPRPSATDAAVRRTGTRRRGSTDGSGGAPASGSRMLGRLQDLDDAERAGAAGERLGTGEDALGEVGGGERERLGPGRDLERPPREVRDRHDASLIGAAGVAVERIVVQRHAALLEPTLVHEHALAPDHDDLGRLLGMDPAEVDVRRDAALELEIADRDVGDPGLQEAVLVQADVRDLARNEVEQDREIVRRRVPPHVRVALDASHAEALEGEMAHVAELAALDEPLHLAHHRIVEERFVDEQDAVPLPRRLDERAAFPRRQRERLLDPHVLPRLERGERHRVMARRRRGEDDRIDVVATQELRVVARAARGGIVGEEGGEPRRVDVAEAGHARGVEPGEGADEVLAPVAEADDADVDARCAHTTRRTRNTPWRCARTQRWMLWAIAKPVAAVASTASATTRADTRCPGQPSAPTIAANTSATRPACAPLSVSSSA